MSKIASIIMIICLIFFSSNIQLSNSLKLETQTRGCHWKSCGNFDLCCASSDEKCKVNKAGDVKCV